MGYLPPGLCPNLSFIKIEKGNNLAAQVQAQTLREAKTLVFEWFNFAWNIFQFKKTQITADGCHVHASVAANLRFEMCLVLV
jgi:hypothetical protein